MHVCNKVGRDKKNTFLFWNQQYFPSSFNALKIVSTPLQVFWDHTQHPFLLNIYNNLPYNRTGAQVKQFDTIPKYF